MCGIIIHVISDAYTPVPLRFPDQIFILESVAPNPKSTVEAREHTRLGGTRTVFKRHGPANGR